MADEIGYASKSTIVKFADDTYVIIPAANADSREVELKNIEEWSQANNLKPNETKHADIVFVNKRPNVKVQPPPPMTETALKAARHVAAPRHQGLNFDGFIYIHYVAPPSSARIMIIASVYEGWAKFRSIVSESSIILSS